MKIFSHCTYNDHLVKILVNGHLVNGLLVNGHLTFCTVDLRFSSNISERVDIIASNKYSHLSYLMSLIYTK